MPTPLFGWTLALGLASAPAGSTAADEAGDPSDAPRWRGTGLLVSGGVLAGVGLGLKATATASDMQTVRDIETGATDPGDCIESCSAGPMFNAMAYPMLAVSIGLVAGGTIQLAKWHVWSDAQTGRAPRRAKLMAGLGGGMLGAGIVAIAAGQSVGRLNLSPGRDAVTSIEAGTWSGIALAATGAALLGYGGSYLFNRPHAGGRVSLAPMVGGGIHGLSLSGRF